MIVFVTGATSGFGAAIARRFARDGHRIIAAGRRVDRLDALRAELGDAVLTVPLDVRDRAAVERAVAELPADLAAIDLLVNNAGLALGLEPAQRASLDDWERMVDTNIKGLMTVTGRCCRGWWRAIAGTSINIGSTAAQLALCRRQRLRRDEGVRPPVLAEPARRSARDAGAGDRRRPGHGGRHRILERALPRRRPRAAQVYEGADPLTPEDVAETVSWVATLPARVNVNAIELMPVGQSFAGLAVARR